MVLISGCFDGIQEFHPLSGVFTLQIKIHPLGEKNNPKLA